MSVFTHRSRAPLRVAGVVLLLAVLSGLTAWSQTPVLTQTAKLTAGGATARDHLGYDVALDFPLAVVGSTADRGAGQYAGGVFVYRHDGSGWIEEAFLQPDDLSPGDVFGVSVSVQDDVIVAGAQNQWGEYKASGAVYVFRFDGDTWHQEAKLCSPDANYLENFGCCVDLDGEWLAIGAQRDADLTWLGGAVWMYRYASGTWTPHQKLYAGNASAGAMFGWSLDLAGDQLVVGATNALTDVRGEAYVFGRSGTTWTQEAHLVSTDSAPGDWFGEGVAIQGDLAVVGAPGYADAGPYQGAAYVFRHQGGTWSQEARLLAPDAQANQWSGLEVAVRGCQAFVGACTFQTSPGSVYVYSSTPGGWLYDYELAPTDGQIGDAFGHDVVVQGSRALVGAPLESSLADRSGAAYVFELLPPPGPIDRLLDLVAIVEGLGLPKGIENALLAKLETALARLEDDNEADDVAAVGALEAFINQVEALAGKEIHSAVAEQLVATALAVIAAIEAA